MRSDLSHFSGLPWCYVASHNFGGSFDGVMGNLLLRMLINMPSTISAVTSYSMACHPSFRAWTGSLIKLRSKQNIQKQMLVLPFCDIFYFISKNAFLPQRPCPETSATFFSRLFYTWFDSFLWRGFRRPLQSKDLWSVNTEETSKKVMPLFSKYWNRAVAKLSETSP